MDYDDSASAIDGKASISTQPVSPPLITFALNPAHPVKGVINFAKFDNVKLHRKGTSRLNNDPFDCIPKDLHQFALRNSTNKLHEPPNQPRRIGS